MNKPLVPALRDIEIFFRPFVHRKLPLSGRIILTPPFGASHLTPPATLRQEPRIALYITEKAAIDDRAATVSLHDSLFYGGQALRAWKALCKMLHRHGAKVAAQLYHAGMSRPLRGPLMHPDEEPIGPSGLEPISLQQLTAPMSRARIAEVAAAFGRSAALAKKLGFDAVEIQGAHGYLIEQFLRKETNKRTDEYGGSLGSRVRFACEVIHAVRKAVGRQFPIIFGISQWNTAYGQTKLANDAAELEELLQPLSDAGVDIFHCSALHHAQPAVDGNALTFAAWIRLLTGKPTISTMLMQDTHHTASSYPTGSTHPIRTWERLIQLLRNGSIDLIALEHDFLQSCDDTAPKMPPNEIK